MMDMNQRLICCVPENIIEDLHCFCCSSAAVKATASNRARNERTRASLDPACAGFFGSVICHGTLSISLKHLGEGGFDLAADDDGVH